MHAKVLVGLFAAGCLLAAGSASAQGKVQAGTLTCSGKGGVGMVVGSQKTFACTYTPTDKRRSERYTATVTRVGLDVGVTGNTTVVWAVLASSANLAPGSLAGNYAGASADASVAVGGGANLLVGGSGKSISLQPLSVQGQTGVNLAVGVSSMTLSRSR